jgi:hypothetical protein
MGSGEREREREREPQGELTKETMTMGTELMMDVGALSWMMVQATPFLTPVMTYPEFIKSADMDENARPLVEMFAESTDVFKALPFIDLSAPLYTGFRQTALSGQMAFRAINAVSTSGAGNISPFQEATFIVDHDIPIDRALVDRGGDRRRAIEEKNAMAELGQLWVTQLISGNNTTTPTVFNGLQARSAQYARTIANSIVSGGAALSLLNLDIAIKNTAKKGKRHMLMPFDMKPYLIQAARTQALTGFVMQTWDESGEEKLSYGGIPILWGYEKDLHPPMLQFTEVGAGGGSAVTGSAYIVDFGEEGLHGIQIKPMEIRDYGLLQDGVTYNTHVHWDVGLVDASLFCFTRLSSFTKATIVA